MVMKRIVLSVAIIFTLVLGLFAEGEKVLPTTVGFNIDDSISDETNNRLNKFVIEKVSFPKEIKRDPTLSKAERVSIVQERLKIKREKEAKIKKAQDEERAKQLAEEKKKKRADELRRNPSKEVIGKIKIQGLIDKEAIINNKIYSVGDRFYVYGNKNPIKVIYINERYVRFEYKGKRFNKTIK